MRRFVLRKLDITTNCFLEQSLFSTEEVRSLAEIVGVNTLEPGMSFILKADMFRCIADLYSLKIARDAECGELICLDDKSKFDFNSHTGRELLLMLKGDKPFAAFVDFYPSDNEIEVIPESYFDRYVKSGAILKFEKIEKQDGKVPRALRRVMYTLPDEDWRAKAYLMLWELTYEYGWNEGFEQIEGYLLGYENNSKIK